MSTFAHRLCAFVVVRHAARTRAGARRDDRSGARSFHGSGAPALRSARLGLLFVAFMAASPVFLLGPEGAFADSCANAAVRVGQSANLPDCRAYEQVSPVDSGFNDILQDPVLSSVTGNAVGYASLGGFAGSASSGLPNAYASIRGAAAWQTTPLNPPYNSTASLNPPFEFGSSADFSKTLVYTTEKLSPDAVEGNANLYVHDTSDGSYQFVGTVPDPNAAFNLNMDYAGAASDGSHFVFSTFQPYMFDSIPATPSSVSQELYDWSGGQLHLVGILPDGSVDPNGARGAGGPSSHAVSDDGGRIYWQDMPNFGGGAVYLREGGQTVLVSARQSDGSPQAAQFWNAARDGSVAYLTSEGKLTNDASPEGPDLYQYDAGSGKLIDLTPDSTDPSGASVEFVLGTSDDGSYVYFVGFGALAAGAVSDAANVYAWHDGTIRLVGTLGNIGSSPNSRVSPDGRYLGFVFGDQISGPHPQNAQPFNEAYLYDYQDDSLVCASCLPDGQQPTGDVRLQEDSFFRDSFEAFKAGASRNVSDGGRFFFESPDALVPGDTNGKLDVYEYQAGQVRLISTGRSDADSFFGDASASGDDVFLTTRERLVGQDQDDNYDLYDARVDGGLAAQNPPASSPPCQADACRTAVSAPAAPPLAASITFDGPGDLSSSPPAVRVGKVKVARKTVKGSRFYLSVEVPDTGRITISGVDLKKVSRAVAKPGTYRLSAALTAKAKKVLKRKQKLMVKARVRYVSTAGKSSNATVSITVKR